MDLTGSPMMPIRTTEPCCESANDWRSTVERRLMTRLVALTSIGLACYSPTSSAQGLDQRTQFFESRIRPALIEHCLDCHSNAAEVNGGLLLDSHAGWGRGGDSGKAIQPGDPQSSLLVRAIQYDDPHLQMPPEGKMPEQVIEDFRRWIRDGAFDPREETTPAKPSTALSLDRAHEYWAYRPIHAAPIPSGAAAAPIDRFLEAKLQSEGLSWTERASRRVLLRRLTFDLHGLPPTPRQLAQFENDTAADAYEKLVDGLLASPRYAERMARRWLDVVRFAESLTLRGFVLPNAWRYRDYCVDQFLHDRPFDQFVREQVGGDLMVAEDLETRRRQLTATTFWLMGNSNLEEQDKQQLEMDIVDEQLDTFGKVFLGQTIGCARCHDHKFDPIPTRDYYALAGVLKSSQVLEHANVSKWIEAPLPMPSSETEHYEQLTAEAKGLAEEITRLRARLTRATQRTTPVVRSQDLPGIVVDDQQATKIGDWQASNFTHVYVDEGYIHDRHQAVGSKTVSFEPAALAPGFYEVRLAYAPGPNRATNARVIVYSADGDTPLSINQTQPPPIDGLWYSLGRYRFEKDGQGYVLISNEDADGHVIADAVQFLAEGEALVADSSPSKPAVASNAGADSSREASATAGNKAELESRLKKLEVAKKKIDALLDERPKVMAMPAIPSASDLAIHIRGDVHNLGAVVPRGPLQLVSLANLPQPEERPFDRLDLGAWLTARENPLLARVTANRVWLWLMGAGLVRTVDNFGTTGEPPSHPELLDYLASRLRDQQWSIRSLVREIVLSEAYQRSSRDLTEPAKIDPDNRWLWRGQRRRLDAETLRDSLLFISQQLDESMAGSEIPKSLKADYGYQQESNRRSLYLPVFRNAVPDIDEVFDGADRSSVVGQRSRSTTARQALWFMHHPWVRQQASATAAQIQRETHSDSTDRCLSFAAQKILGRSLTREERLALDEHLGYPPQLTPEQLTDVVVTLFQSLDFRFPE
jgi:hypothetical protein